jgi:hypothetical protein
MEGFPPRVAFPEKARLIRRHAAAESDYNRAIHVLSAAIRSQKKPDGYVVEDFADSARKMVEDAWEALERHTGEHGC